MRIRPLSISLACLLLGSGTAAAYPSAVIFAPSGDARPFGNVSAFIYSSVLYDYPAAPGARKPIAPGGTWAGLEFGVVPRFEYGSSGLSFGGLEIGADLLASDLVGITDAQGNSATYIKPVFNAKLHFLVESGWAPHLSVGLMGFNPFRMNRSLNILYGSASKSLVFGETDLGRLTLGMGGVLGDFDDDPYREVLPAWYGAAPFGKDSRALLLGGYESPLFGPFYLAIDHFGGNSELSSTNVAINFLPMDGGLIAAGGFFGNDPDAWLGGIFAYLYMNMDLAQVFGKKEEPPPATPASAPAAAQQTSAAEPAPAAAQEAPAAAQEAPAASP